MINGNIEKLLLNSNSVAIFLHTNPDGDAIGSGIGLKEGLEQLGKKVEIFSESPIPKEFYYLNPSCISRNYNTKDNFELAVVLDCPDVNRIGKMTAVFNNCKQSLNIDHHLNNSNLWTEKICEPSSSATCQLVFELLIDLGVKITSNIARALYTGLATDTGCFMFNLNEKTHLIANDLIKYFDDVENVNYIQFRSKTFNECKLYGEALKKLELALNKRIAITDIGLKDFERTNTTIEDTTSIVFHLSGISGVDIICVMCEEKLGQYKISFRSLKTDVCELAKLFGGGGHKYASGCKIYGTRNTVKNKILSVVEKYLCTE